MNINQIYGDYNKQLQEQIAQAQAQSQPQGGVLGQVDPNWLALAQGFLSPTKTGGFGESLGNAAGALQGPLAKMKEQQMSAQDRINKLREMQMRLALETYRAQKGGADGGDDLNDEYKRALALSHYGNMIEKLDPLLHERYATAVAIEKSNVMMKKLRQKFNNHDFVELVENDIVDCQLDRVQIHILFLTMMFIPVHKRQKVLDKVRTGTKKGGVIIIVDKVCDHSGYFGTVLKRLGMHWKIKQGAKLEDVAAKEMSLQGRCNIVVAPHVYSLSVKDVD